MVGAVTRAWAWLVDGLTEALASVLDRLGRQECLQVEAREGPAPMRTSGGVELGHCVVEAEGGRLDPPDLARRLNGQAIDIVIPSSWIFRRSLEPVAAQSAPYLDAFVRHQIDRITPWRVADVYYRILHAPLPGDASRLAVEVGVVPRRLVGGLVEALGSLSPKHLRLVARSQGDTDGFTIPLAGREAQRHRRLRTGVLAGSVAILLAMPATLGWLWWSIATVQAEIDSADRAIAERKAVLAAAARHDQATTAADEALKHLIAARGRVVDVVEALSAALPDDAYLTELTIEKDHVRLSGVSTNTPQLVPALETSGHFTDAAFFAATTRLESAQGDRFFIEMRASGRHDSASAP